MKLYNYNSNPTINDFLTLLYSIHDTRKCVTMRLNSNLQDSFFESHGHVNIFIDVSKNNSEIMFGIHSLYIKHNDIIKVTKNKRFITFRLKTITIEIF